MPTLSIDPQTQLEGFTKTVIHRHLLAPGLPNREKSRLVTRIATLIAQGETCTVLSAREIGDGEWDYLVNGPNRFLVRGKGNTPEAFTENDERLTFFFKPSCAPLTTRQIEGRSIPNGSPEQAESVRLTLTRDEQYCYRLTNHITLIATTCLQVELASRTHYIQFSASPFWEFVFGGQHPKNEISVTHAAQLLGLSVLTLSRRIGEEKLPAVRPESLHPGITRAGLEEYIAYRKEFPQGCISPRQVDRWHNWQATWRQRYQEALANGS